MHAPVVSLPACIAARHPAQPSEHAPLVQHVAGVQILARHCVPYAMHHVRQRPSSACTYMRYYKCIIIIICSLI